MIKEIRDPYFAVVGPDGFIKHSTSEDDIMKHADKMAKSHPGKHYHILKTITTVKYPIGDAVWNNNFPAKLIEKDESEE